MQILFFFSFSIIVHSKEVLFPQPISPTIANVSPFFARKFMFFNIKGRPTYLKEAFFISVEKIATTIIVKTSMINVPNI